MIPRITMMSMIIFKILLNLLPLSSVLGTDQPQPLLTLPLPLVTVLSPSFDAAQALDLISK